MFQSIITDDQLNAVIADYQLSLVMSEYVGVKEILQKMTDNRHYGLAISVLVETMNSINLSKSILDKVNGEIFKQELPALLDRMYKNLNSALRLTKELMDGGVKPRDLTIAKYKSEFNKMRTDNFLRLKSMLSTSTTFPSSQDEKEIALNIIDDLISSLTPEKLMN